MDTDVIIARIKAVRESRLAVLTQRPVEITLTPEQLVNPEVYLAYIELVEAMAASNRPPRMHVRN